MKTLNFEIVPLIIYRKNKLTLWLSGVSFVHGKWSIAEKYFCCTNIWTLKIFMKFL